jgi:hypothetical protein
MDWGKILKVIVDKGNLLAGATLTMLVVVIGTRLGFFSQLAVEWYEGIRIVGIFTLMALISGAAIAAWPLVKRPIQQRIERKRRYEYSIKNFEALDDPYELRCLLYIKNKGKQRFKYFSNSDALQAMVDNCLLDTDDLYERGGGYTHYYVPDHLWKRMQSPDWAKGIKVEMFMEPWSPRL